MLGLNTLKAMAVNLRRECQDERADTLERVVERIEASRKHISNDLTKLRDAQRVLDKMTDCADKDALVFAVLQWMHVAFIDHSPLSEKERAWGEQVAARLKARVSKDPDWWGKCCCYRPVWLGGPHDDPNCEFNR